MNWASRISDVCPVAAALAAAYFLFRKKSKPKALLCPKSRPKLVAICGFQGSGKDTIGTHLVEQHGFVRLTFAGALKDVVSIVFSWDRNKLEGVTAADREWREQVDVWWAKELNIPHLTPRWVLQYFGTDLFRKHFHPDVWTSTVKRKIDDYHKQGLSVVITDCRFQNEIDFVQAHGGHVLHVHRELPAWFDAYQNGENTKEVESMHASETSWIRSAKSATRLPNTRSIQDLYVQVDEWIIL